MTLEKGIRAFFPGVRTAEEIKEQAEAKAVIKAKLDQLDSEFKLQAAPTPPINVELNLPAETKGEDGYNPSQNKQIEKYIATRPSFKESNGKWREFVARNERAKKEKKDNENRRQQQLMPSWGLDKEKQKQKNHYKKLVDFGIGNSSVKYTGSRQHLYDEWDKTDLLQKIKKFYQKII